jgi:hypothetical protein
MIGAKRPNYTKIALYNDHRPVRFEAVLVFVTCCIYGAHEQECGGLLTQLNKLSIAKDSPRKLKHQMQLMPALSRAREQWSACGTHIKFTPPAPQVFADVVRYYDSDQSGDLNMEELARLLRACGLELTKKEVRTCKET